MARWIYQRQDGSIDRIKPIQDVRIQPQVGDVGLIGMNSVPRPYHGTDLNARLRKLIVVQQSPVDARKQWLHIDRLADSVVERHLEEIGAVKDELAHDAHVGYFEFVVVGHRNEISLTGG